MHAALRTLVIGAIVAAVESLNPRSSPAQAHTAPTSGQARARSLSARGPATPTCQAAQLAIAQDASSGATGHLGIELRLHNVSAHACTLQGYPTLVLLDRARRPLPTVLHWGPGGFFNFNRPVRLVRLAPGGNAYVAMGWTHIPTPGQTCPRAANLLILPPGASSAFLVAVGHGAVPAYGGVDACGGKLAVSAVEPTHFVL